MPMFFLIEQATRLESVIQCTNNYLLDECNAAKSYRFMSYSVDSAIHLLCLVGPRSIDQRWGLELGPLRVFKYPDSALATKEQGENIAIIRAFKREGFANSLLGITNLL